MAVLMIMTRMMSMMVIRVMIMMMNIEAMQIMEMLGLVVLKSLCDHILKHRVRVVLLFFLVPSPMAPCHFDVPGLACGEKIYLIYIYMYILFFAQTFKNWQNMNKQTM